MTGAIFIGAAVWYIEAGLAIVGERRFQPCCTTLDGDAMGPLSGATLEPLGDTRQDGPAQAKLRRANANASAIADLVSIVRDIEYVQP